MNVTIIANGCIKDMSIIKTLAYKSGYIICTDGAAGYLAKTGVVPDLLIGDMDSISKHDLEWIRKENVACKIFSPRKNQTDSEIAVDYALKLKPETITIIGAIGDRLDHSLGNIMLLYKIMQNGVIGKIIDELNEVVISRDIIHIEGNIGDTVSIIPLSPIVKGLTLKGFEYPLTDSEIVMGSTIGISNEMLEEKAVITLKEGVILVVKPCLVKV